MSTAAGGTPAPGARANLKNPENPEKPKNLKNTENTENTEVTEVTQDAGGSRDTRDTDDPGERGPDDAKASDEAQDSPGDGRGGADASADDGDDGDDGKPSGLAGVMSAIFLPILPALIGAGLLSGITTLLTSTGLLSQGNSFYLVLTTMSSAVFYFLPFLLAASTAKAFDASPYLAIATVAFFLYPDMVAAMAGSDDLSLFGIPIVKTTYTSSVIPIILMIWGMAHVARLAHRIVPSVLETILVPPIVLAVTGVLGLLIIGPVGAALTEAVAAVVQWLHSVAPWIVPVLVGALGSLMVAFGLSFALFPIALVSITTVGYDDVYGPGMLASNMALAGMATAVAVKARDSDYRAFSFSAGATALLGVAQPALYGCAMTLRRPFAGVFAGGAVGGLVAGLTGFHVYAMMPAGATAVAAWIDDSGWGNPLSGLAIMVVAFAVSFAVTWFVGYEQPSRARVQQLSDR